MIEVLVSVFVLALGVIGAAGMQLVSLRTTQQSAFQTAALQLASEMADKMRANANQMGLPDDQNPFLALNYKSATDAAPEAPAKLCFSATCSASELASADIYDLQRRVKELLPSGRVTICRDTQPWDESINGLAWDCTAGAGNGSVVIKMGWQEKAADGKLIKNENDLFPPAVALTVQPYAQ
nr:type IV pilus modification protein PilV [Noviherbaspirillum cavernae]